MASGGGCGSELSWPRSGPQPLQILRGASHASTQAVRGVGGNGGRLGGGRRSEIDGVDYTSKQHRSKRTVRSNQSISSRHIKEIVALL